MASLEDLQAKLSESRALSKRIACKMTEVSRQAKSRGGPPPATARMQAVALRVFALADMDVRAPVAYLRARGRRADCDEVSTWFAALPAEEKHRLSLQPIGPGALLSQWSEAKRFLSELAAFSWVKAQNKKSIAPSPGAVLRHVSDKVGLQGKRNTKHRWLQRVFSRLGCRKGIFATGDQLSKEVFESKAAAVLAGRKSAAFSAARAASIWVPKCVHLFGPAFASNDVGGLKSRPHGGTQIGAAGSLQGRSRSSLQARREARACWRWSNFLSAGGKGILRVNLDESSLKMFMGGGPGLVAEPCPKRRRQLLREGKGPSLATRRAAATLIAFVCDDPDVQPRLPQVIVTNKHLMSEVAFDEISARCRGRVLMVRRDSAWVDTGFMVEIVRALAIAIRAELASRRVILHMDTCPVHSRQAVLKECSVAGLHVHFIPAATTAWLQPLDVAVFAKLKRWTVHELERLRLESTTGLLSHQDVLDTYRRAIETIVCQGSWGKAFDLCGLRGQERMSKQLMARLGFVDPPAVDASLPSLTDLVVTFPARMNIPIDDLFELPLRAATPQAPVLRLLPRARLPPLHAL